jgi:NADH-quinone oxidoreductase subunit H
MLTGSLSTQQVVMAQHNMWFIIPQLVGAGVFLIAGMAENATHPFDLTEAESELVAGYMTEYPGMLGFLFLAAELGTTFTLSALFTTFFLGGWQPPPILSFLDVPIVWFLAKSYLMFVILTIARFSMPRFRIDQFLAFGWKVLTPLAFANLIVAAVEVVATKGYFQP